MEVVTAEDDSSADIQVSLRVLELLIPHGPSTLSPRTFLITNSTNRHRQTSHPSNTHQTPSLETFHRSHPYRRPRPPSHNPNNPTHPPTPPTRHPRAKPFPSPPPSLRNDPLPSLRHNPRHSRPQAPLLCQISTDGLYSRHFLETHVPNHLPTLIPTHC